MGGGWASALLDALAWWANGWDLLGGQRTERLRYQVRV